MSMVRAYSVETDTLFGVGTRRVMFLSPENIASIFSVLPFSGHEQLKFYSLENFKLLSCWVGVECREFAAGGQSVSSVSIVEESGSAKKMMVGADQVFVFSLKDGNTLQKWLQSDSVIIAISGEVSEIAGRQFDAFFPASYHTFYKEFVPDTQRYGAFALTLQEISLMVSGLVTIISSFIHESLMEEESKP